MRAPAQKIENVVNAANQGQRPDGTSWHESIERRLKGIMLALITPERSSNPAGSTVRLVNYILLTAEESPARREWVRKQLAALKELCGLMEAELNNGDTSKTQGENHAKAQ